MSNEQSSERVIKSYVWHEGTIDRKCYFVSTIERDCSAAACQSRYNETIVWDYDWDKKERGEMVYQGEDIRGSVERHLLVCRTLHKDGLEGLKRKDQE